MRIYNGDEWQPPQHVELVADIGSIHINPGREAVTSLSHQIRTDGQERMLWITDEAPAYGHEIIESSIFENKPNWAKGREDSVQGVFFGELVLGQEFEVPVAVKPFLTAVSTGAHETAMLLDLESKGLRVYRVLGIAWSINHGFAMITGFEEESKSLDNVDWDKGLNEPIGGYLTNLEAIEQVGQSLGLMHANGIIHGDAGVKNFAVNGSEVVLTDLAQARSTIREDGYVDEIALQSGMYRDLERFVDDLVGRGFLSGANDEEWGSFFVNVIAPAYRSGLYKANGERLGESTKLKPIVEQVIEDISQRYSA